MLKIYQIFILRKMFFFLFKKRKKKNEQEMTKKKRGREREGAENNRMRVKGEKINAEKVKETNREESGSSIKFIQQLYEMKLISAHS